MQPHTPPSSSIFNTQPTPTFPSYQKFISQLKSYTHHLNHHLDNAIIHQNKTITRKKIELQQQLHYLKDELLSQKTKILQIQNKFKVYCHNPIQEDIQKWQQYQQFFQTMLNHYQYQIQIQSLINLRNTQKIKLLKQQLKQSLKTDIGQSVIQKLQTKASLSKSNINSKRSLSVKSQSKLTQFKIKTEASQYTHPTQINDNVSTKLKIKTKKLHTQETQSNKLPLLSQKIVRLKTDMSLPSLKKSTIVNFEQRVQNDDFNFMKPIKTVKKQNLEESLIPEIIKLFHWHNKKIQQKQIQPDWFQKVVFNKRNFEKIMSHLDQEFEFTSGKKKFPKTANKVKDLVAKNLFRLKTESSGTKNKSKTQLKQRSLLNFLEKSQQILK